MDQSSGNTMVLTNLAMRSQKHKEQACLQSNQDLVIILCIKQRDLCYVRAVQLFGDWWGNTYSPIYMHTDRQTAGWTVVLKG